MVCVCPALGWCPISGYSQAPGLASVPHDPTYDLHAMTALCLLGYIPWVPTLQ